MAETKKTTAKAPAKPRAAKKAPLVDAEALKAKAEAEEARKAAEAAAEADHEKRLEAAVQAFFEGTPGDSYAGITREEAEQYRPREGKLPIRE